MKKFAVVLIMMVMALVWTSLGYSQEKSSPTLTLTWEVSGLKEPETAVYDPKRNVIHVSNINGNLMEKGTIADKKLYGDWSYYNENGKLKENGRYDINGKKIGIWQTYHNDGNLKSKGNYENGLAHGEFDHWATTRSSHGWRYRPIFFLSSRGQRAYTGRLWGG